MWVFVFLVVMPPGNERFGVIYCLHLQESSEIAGKGVVYTALRGGLGYWKLVNQSREEMANNCRTDFSPEYLGGIFLRNVGI
jgi:hypothetical protein